MQWTSAIAIYFIMWFFCLFLVLPFHARRAAQEDSGSAIAGTDRGAPARFAPGRAALQVTILSALVFGLYYANYTQGWITRDSFAFLPQPPDR